MCYQNFENLAGQRSATRNLRPCMHFNRFTNRIHWLNQSVIFYDSFCIYIYSCHKGTQYNLPPSHFIHLNYQMNHSTTSTEQIYSKPRTWKCVPVVQTSVSWRMTTVVWSFQAVLLTEKTTLGQTPNRPPLTLSSGHMRPSLTPGEENPAWRTYREWWAPGTTVQE